jgi:hypothetical protein
MKTYTTVLTQYIAPEYGDDEKRYHAQKEIEMPFVPLLSKDIGLIHPDLGKYVWFVQSLHYNVGEDKFYLTLHSRWFQLWDDREYLYDDTIKEMEKYVAYLREHGWTVTERKE